MAMTGTRVAPLGRIRMRGPNHSVWHKFLGPVLEPQSWNVEEEVVEYLDHHRHDLPPEVSIELERHRPAPQGRPKR
jgi:hypothetical protein